MNIKGLTFSFDKNGDYFFKNESVTFDDGEVHFIEGDNGVGKSTFFSILSGKTSQSSLLELSVSLQNKVYDASGNQLPGSFVSQVHTVYQQYDTMIADRFTVMENLQLANLPIYPGLKRLPQATMFELIEKMSIDITKPAYLLSGGQRQLLAILMALQKPTKILLLDEPTATLDKHNAQLIMQILHQLAGQLKVTMLIICHDKQLVANYGRRVIKIEQLANGQRQFVRSKTGQL